MGDYLEVSEEKNLNNEYTKENVLSVSGDVGIVNQIEFQGRSFAGILVNNYGVVKTGYVVYTKSPLKNNPYGIIKANKGRDGIVSTLYAIYKPKVNVNSNFIQIYFEQNARMNNYMQPLVNKGAKNDMKISSENALKGNVIFPIRKEQDIIVDLFFKIDHLITLHRSKFFGDILKTIASYTLYWEQRKFGELFLEKRDKTEREDEDILLSCAITGIYLNSELFSHFRGTSNIGYLKIKKNDLILSAQNLHLGNVNVNLLFEHGIISPAYKVYELNKCDQYFVQSWVKKDSTKDFFLDATTEGASQCRKNIDWCILNNQLIAIPSLYEQIRIGKLFHCLNHLITLHQLEPFQLIFKAIAYRIIDYAKSKPPRYIKYKNII